jgi:hypothetical protein
MIKKLILIGICIGGGILAVCILYGLSGTPNSIGNGFKRHIKQGYLVSYHSEDLHQTAFQLSGFTKTSLFVSNLDDPLHVFTIDSGLTRFKPAPWTIPIPTQSNNLSVFIDSPDIAVYDRRNNLISSFQNIRVAQNLKFRDSVSEIQFDLGSRVSETSFALRTINRQLNQYTLAKYVRGQQHILENKNAIIKQLDGFICSDGILLYDSSCSRIIYLYFYRNQFLILDSNLKLLARAKTIDTCGYAQIRLHHFIKEKYTTFEAPALMVNKKACVWNGRLYIQSGLVSDNEDRRIFSNNSIVDVYDLTNAKYLYSFYIPHFNQFKLDGFQVRENMLFAIQGNFIVSYIIKSG